MPHPPKKKRCLRNKQFLKREDNRNRREKETIDDTHIRLEAKRTSAASSRADESADAREKRLEVMRTFAAKSLANESAEEKRKRLEAKRDSAATCRAEESEDRREKRLEVMRTFAAKSLANESDEEKRKRLEAMRASAATGRAEESEDRREKRLEVMRNFAAKSLANESAEEKRKRLEAKRDSAETCRAEESEDRREKRLEVMRTFAAKSMANESAEDKRKRLEAKRDSAATCRAEESEDKREKRLEVMRTFAAKSLAIESAEEKRKRLEAKRDSAATCRAEESEDRREKRLEVMRTFAAKSLANESAEEKRKRLEAMRASAATGRAEESQDEKMKRLEAARVSTAEYRVGKSAEERQRRLEKKRASASASRANECEKKRERRLEKIKLSAAGNRLQKWRSKENSAFHYNNLVDYASDSACGIGAMSHQCVYCSAMKWRGEASGMCCSGGKVKLTSLTHPPEVLRSLLSDVSNDAKHFQNNFRLYNSCFAMTSFGTTNDVREHGFMPTFKVQGQIYHRIGSLHPSNDEPPKFLQVYFIEDHVEQAAQRCRNVPKTKEYLVQRIQEMLHRENSYVRNIKMSMEKITPEHLLVIPADRTPDGEHRGRFNAPSSSEVAIIMTGEKHGNRDIVLNLRNNSLETIAETHRAYDALQYPLLFWKGEDGYHFELKQVNPTTGLQTNKKISAMEFYSFRIMFRPDDFNIILRGKNLYQQYLVDMYAKIEAERLRYISLNQKKLRVEEYAHLRDAVANDGDLNDVGKLTILPSSFTGSPRYMHERTQDAMSYVRTYGKPDLFITFTCNPAWEEIKKELFPSQKPQDRHDLLARVFHMKHKVLMNLITKANIFGSVQCFMYTIEWQKRGLPHAHVLIWLKEKIRAQRIDEFISAEIPDNREDPELFSCITTQMVHGPCGLIHPKAPCMIAGKCSKRYPRPFLSETKTGTDSYPLYRRRRPEEGGNTAVLHVRGSEIIVDNRWIVPYCPLLSKIFNAHINVEFCSSIKSIKYVCKYINKGSDMAVFQLTKTESEANEVQDYLMGRYISSNEAAWRILGFPVHGRFPTVVHLSVHLENGQRVYFTPSNAFERAQNPQDTTLTSFFKLCEEDEFAQRLLYNEVPKYYTWNSRSKKWNRRKIGITDPNNPGVKLSEALGRVYTVHPNNSECFHLRLLLHTVRGPTSFQSLKTFEGKLCETFKEACKLRGILENDDHWNMTLEEAALSRSPSMLRNLFSIMLHTCAISNCLELWMNHRESLSEDILYQERIRKGDTDLQLNEDMHNKTLALIEDKLLSLGSSDLKSFGLPQPAKVGILDLPANFIPELCYDTQQLEVYLQKHEPKLTPDQKHVYEKITGAVFQNTGGVFFLDAPGGTGKTFVINLILAKVRQRNEIALAVASSGIAATILTGGRTAHSTFKLPLNLATAETPTCNIPRGSEKAIALQKGRLIVWDECTASHKAGFEALDATLQDLRRDSNLMGGITLLLAGDFRQTLPVIPRGTRADEISSCLKSSYIWGHVEKLHLRTNMRALQSKSPSSTEFAKNILKMGNGLLECSTHGGLVSVEDIGNIVDSPEKLRQAIFPALEDHFQDHGWLRERAILCPRNDMVRRTNEMLLKHLPGNKKTFKSIDTVSDIGEAVNYPTEFLNSLDLPGIPSHVLELKEGAPIILLRNLDPPALCNGTRLSVKKLQRNVIEATIITGPAAGKDVFIPRIPLYPSDPTFPFKRLQFPVCLSFAITINKAQGQTFKTVGVDLTTPCFSHGQLYVACSRVGCKDDLFLLSPNGRTLNIVYPEALRD